MGEIVKFPNGKPNAALDDILEEQHQARVDYADSLTEYFAGALLQIMQGSGMNIQQKRFVHCYGYMINALRACVYSDMTIDHPFHPHIMNIVKEWEEKGVEAPNIFIEPVWDEDEEE